jgi:hypothetical protein
MVVILNSLLTEFNFTPELDDTVVYGIAGISYCSSRTEKDMEFLAEMNPYAMKK